MPALVVGHAVARSCCRVGGFGMNVPTALSQLPLIPLARRGGFRPHSGRKVAAVPTVVVRVPSPCLNSVTEIITAYRSGVPLKAVTEINDDVAALSAIVALREYFRSEFLMGQFDSSFECWVMESLKTVTVIKEEGVLH